jgi:GT2 family glycosyltransferase
MLHTDRDFPNVAITIVNWNGWKDTIDCLHSVLDCEYAGRLHIVLCDNASTDGSVTHIRNWLSDRNHFKPRALMTSGDATSQSSQQVWEYDLSTSRLVAVIQNGENAGYAGGNNIALRYVLGRYSIEYAWILNNDTVAANDALQHMLARMSESSSIGICGATLLYQEQPESVQAYGGVKYSKCTGRGVHLGAGDRYSAEANRDWVEQNLSYVSGACMLVSRPFLDDVGLMNEEYFLYGEELDWVQRAKGRYRLGYAPKAIVYHKEGATIGTASKGSKASLISEFYQTRNKLWFTRKYLPYCLPSVWSVMLAQALKRFAVGQPENAKVMLRVLFGQKKPSTAWITTPVK